MLSGDLKAWGKTTADVVPLFLGGEGATVEELLAAQRAARLDLTLARTLPEGHVWTTVAPGVEIGLPRPQLQLGSGDFAPGKALPPGPPPPLALPPGPPPLQLRRMNTTGVPRAKSPAQRAISQDEQILRDEARELQMVLADRLETLGLPRNQIPMRGGGPDNFTSGLIDRWWYLQDQIVFQRPRAPGYDNIPRVRAPRPGVE
jgi:hypothetical protein